MNTSSTPPKKNIDGIKRISDISSRKVTRRTKFNTLRTWRVSKSFLITCSILIIGGSIVLGVLLFTNRQQDRSETDVNAIAGFVAKHYLLPSDEIPALITVTDKSKVQSAFFLQAENGDKVLIYQKNRLAIIYRPNIDRVIATGPVSIDTPKK